MLYGFVSPLGVETVPLEYDSFELIHPEYRYAVVKEDEQWGVLDLDENAYLVLPIYDGIEYVYYKDSGHCFYFLKLDGKYGLGDEYGDTLLPVEYDSIAEFAENIVIVSKNGKYELVDFNDEVLGGMSFQSEQAVNLNTIIKKSKASGAVVAGTAADEFESYTLPHIDHDFSKKHGTSATGAVTLHHFRSAGTKALS